MEVKSLLEITSPVRVELEFSLKKMYAFVTLSHIPPFIGTGFRGSKPRVISKFRGAMYKLFLVKQCRGRW